MKGQNKANQASPDWLLSAVHHHDVFRPDISVDNPAGAEMLKSRGQLPNNGSDPWNTCTFCNKTILDVNLSECYGDVTSGIFDCHVSFDHTEALLDNF